MKDIKILSLNCQKGYQTGLKEFLNKVLKDGQYDFLLLQERQILLVRVKSRPPVNH